MPVVRIDALCACEGCEKRFGVEIEPDFEALVRDTISGGNTTHYVWDQPTIQAGLMLCDVCSRKCDEEPIDGALTRAQVNKALGLPETET